MSNTIQPQFWWLTNTDMLLHVLLRTTGTGEKADCGKDCKEMPIDPLHQLYTSSLLS